MRPQRAGLRRLANLLNGSTLAGLALARAAGCRVVDGPDRLRLALDYPGRFPAPRAGAVTVGDVVLLRLPSHRAADLPALIRHEARHADQWALWLGPVGFLPAYGLAALWSWLRHRDAAVGNWFELRAGLEDGGYDDARRGRRDRGVRGGSPRPARRSARRRRTRR